MFSCLAFAMARDTPAIALYCGALVSYSRAAAVCGSDAEAAAAIERRRVVAAAVNSAFWDEERGVYVDAVHEGRSRTVSQHANGAILAFCGVAEARAARAISYVMSPGRVKLTTAWRWDEDRPFDPERDVVMAQPFFSSFLHLGLRAYGREGETVNRLRTLWGALLERADTYSEMWQETSVASRCHGFSSTPASDLQSDALGISPTGDTGRVYRFRLPDLDLPWAKGVVPTAAGDLGVEWTRESSVARVRLVVPEGLRVVVARDGAGDLAVGAGERTIALPRRNG